MTKDLVQISKELRLSALKMAYDCGKNGSHVGPGLSSIEIMATLYGDVLRYDVNNPNNENRDRLVVSKGHCVLAYYSALNKVGFLSDEDIASFETNGSHFHGHAMRNLENGIEFSGGSLSMGMTFAVGLALSCKRKGLPSRVFVLVGDGECDEGSVWEAAASASHFGLKQLTAVVDMNAIQYDGYTSDVLNMAPFARKWADFGWDVLTIDGHDPEAVLDAYMHKSDKPLVILAKTVKGKGISFMEHNWRFHNASLTKAQYEQAVAELESAV